MTRTNIKAFCTLFIMGVYIIDLSNVYFQSILIQHPQKKCCTLLSCQRMPQHRLPPSTITNFYMFGDS
jgi:hypothetical protein